nr:hypothetical protein [Vibrio maritimus]
MESDTGLPLGALFFLFANKQRDS